VQEDVDAFFRDFGVPVFWKSVDPFSPDAMAFLDFPDEVVLERVVLHTAATLTYPSGRLAGLDEGETIQVGGESYRVRERPRRIDDGRLTQAFLTRA
jgi:hypothetical protein